MYIPLITKHVDLFPFGDKDSNLTNHPGYANTVLTLKPKHQANPLFIKVKNCTRNPKQYFNKFRITSDIFNSFSCPIFLVVYLYQKAKTERILTLSKTGA